MHLNACDGEGLHENSDSGFALGRYQSRRYGALAMPVPGKAWRKQVKILLRKENPDTSGPLAACRRSTVGARPGPLAALERAAVQAWFI
jgi:hypothetical protein